ncbi:MAG: dihydrodipicolinate reductase [Candidatus Tectimicrobiota bacterium]
MDPQSLTGAISFGLGPIGRETARRIASAARLALVGAVDIDLALAGRPLTEVVGPEAPEGLTVAENLEEACAQAAAAPGGIPPEVVVHCTGSHLQEEAERLRACLEEGLHVVSSCEELAAPELRWPEFAAALARETEWRGLTILATGVNPGFVMDRLPLVATGMCRRLEGLAVRRVVDLATRRVPLQRKMAVGMTPEAFDAAHRAGTLGHVGLTESLACLSRALGRPLTLEAVKERVEPVLAEEPQDSALGRVEPGQVAGIRHTVATRGGAPPRLVLELVMAVGAGPPEDTVIIDGDPPFTLTIPGGLDGDPATCAALVNAIPVAKAAPAGLLTPADRLGPIAFPERW